MYIELEQDNLNEVLSENNKVVVQYGATWCGNCKIIKPKFKMLSSENEDVQFIYVDAEKLPESRKFAQVTNLPTFASFLNGELVAQSQGNKIEVIKEVLEKLN